MPASSIPQGESGGQLGEGLWKAICCRVGCARFRCALLELKQTEVAIINASAGMLRKFMVLVWV
jgi:hypothetical protein